MTYAPGDGGYSAPSAVASEAGAGRQFLQVALQNCASLRRIPAVGIRIDGALGEPIVVIPGAILGPEAAVAYAQKIFQAAADACQQARNQPVAGHA